MITYLILHLPSQFPNSWVTEHWYHKLEHKDRFQPGEMKDLKDLRALLDRDYKRNPYEKGSQGLSYGIEELLLQDVFVIWCVFADNAGEFTQIYTYERHLILNKPPMGDL